MLIAKIATLDPDSCKILAKGLLGHLLIARTLLQTMTKVKASDKFTFPFELDMKALIDNEVAVIDLDSQEDGLSEVEYELAAILIHKGPSAFHGHYGMPC